MFIYSSAFLESSRPDWSIEPHIWPPLQSLAQQVSSPAESANHSSLSAAYDLASCHWVSGCTPTHPHAGVGGTLDGGGVMNLMTSDAVQGCLHKRLPQLLL